MTHAETLARKAVDDARGLLGPGWDHVSHDIRWGLVAAEIVAIMGAQDESISDSRIVALVRDVTYAARKLL